jgi:23S rRNA (uracil1939-C5)-methyltransferase
LEKQQVRIEKLVYGGEGLGRLSDGRSVFVPFVLPGELVVVEVTEEKQRYARGKAIRWLEMSEKRITPPCPYFGDCGGCHYQHMRYGDQIETKVEILKDLFSRNADIDDLPLRVVELSDKEYHYRNAVRLHVADDGTLGFLEQGSNLLVPIDDCLLSKGQLQKFLKQFTLSTEDSINSVEFRWDSSDEVMIIIDSDDMTPPEVSIDFTGSIVYQSPAGQVVLAGSELQVFSVGNYDFVVSAGSFFQANLPIAERMVAFLESRLPEEARGTLFDLYCGVGLFSRFFAERFGKVVGIEQSPSAVADFVVNLDEYDHIEIYEGAVEDIVPGLAEKPDVVIVDPPRSGLAGSVVDWMAEHQVPWIAYVSCDPATLARDVKRLMLQGYRLEEVAFFDQFPQTFHVECVAVMSWVEQ